MGGWTGSWTSLPPVSTYLEISTSALGSVTTPVGEAYYFFNPFGDYWLGADYPLEAGAEFTDTRHTDDVAAAEDLLRRAPVGTWTLTYNGFGGRVPAGYELIRVDWELSGVLRLWRKQPDTTRIGTRRRMNAQSRGQLALVSRPAHGTRWTSASATT